MYAELNDFLGAERRQRALTYRFTVSPSVKDVIEALGVPHTEVDLVLVNGESVGFEHRVADGDRVAAFPVFETFDVSPLVKVRPAPLREPRFVLDVHLGTLTRWLRLVGFDAAWDRDADDETLARRSAEEHRILLTRDRGLLKRSTVTHGYWVRAVDPDEQLVEVVGRFQLAAGARPFSRCLACGGALTAADAAAVASSTEPGTRRRHTTFTRCERCGKVYWKGAHHDRLRRLVERALG